MTAHILDGKRLASKLQVDIARRVAERISEGRSSPTLAAVLVGDDPASDVYVRKKQEACQRTGIHSRLIRLPQTCTTQQLQHQIDQLNADPQVHGILIQLPLPPAIDPMRILQRVDPSKDVDGFHPWNVGLLAQGKPRFIPCTPHGVLQLLVHHHIEVSGKHVVIVGRSDIVGKPLAMLLAAKDSPLGPQMANGTVTLCHSRTLDLAGFTQRADILVAAIGSPRAIDSSMVKRGAVVIDVGVNRTPQGLVGDVDFDSVAPLASQITPVPGGVGPLTVTMLLENTLRAADQPSSGGDTG